MATTNFFFCKGHTQILLNKNRTEVSCSMKHMRMETIVRTYAYTFRQTLQTRSFWVINYVLTQTDVAFPSYLIHC